MCLNKIFFLNKFTNKALIRYFNDELQVDFMGSLFMYTDNFSIVFYVFVVDNSFQYYATKKISIFVRFVSRELFHTRAGTSPAPAFSQDIYEIFSSGIHSRWNIFKSSGVKKMWLAGSTLLI